MIKKGFMLALCALIVSTNTIYAAEVKESIEVFDIEKGLVVKNVSYKSDVHDVTKDILQNISGVYKNVHPFPKKGLMMKIPVDPDIFVQNSWFVDYVNEMIVIFSEVEHDPYLLLWDDENNPQFLTTKFDRKELFKSMEYYPNLAN